ncbi:hypothetical protein SteCoe_14351 [Stentor coeruleus]|uniref:Peroxisomal membrane protein 4 n=1 Tax=Stentor coeruleus TaxID=5963 RepID=A0A1R2C694_9CILI|nr:hypothetical protein SteCoe_14351 [Stentor coeruleus]
MAEISMEDKRLCKHKGSCTENTLKGLLKALIQGFAAKSCMHFLLNVLLRRGYRKPLESLLGFFSLDALRFTAFAGLMNFLFKSTLCTMRNFRKKEDGLNYIVAGAISGLSIVVEDKDRRETWSLYFAARLVDIVLRGMGKRYGGWDVNKIEVYMFMFMIFFLVWSYGAEKDNLIKSYFNFLNMLYHPSKIERKIMDEWCKVNTLKNPLKA